MALPFNSGSSTTNIFYFDANHTYPLLTLKLRPDVPVTFGIPDNFTIPDNILGLQPIPPTILSSYKGLIVCRSNFSGRYYVGNPYIFDVPIPSRYVSLPHPPPNFHHPNNTHVVLAIDLHQSLVFPIPSVFLVICAIQQAGNAYIVDTFDSHDRIWRTFPSVLADKNYGPIVPNSGVGFGRAAFWLLDQSPSAVLSLYATAGDGQPVKATVFILQPLPVGQARMQLGRVFGRPGLVIVNAAESTVELLILKTDDNDPWQRRELFNVQLLVDDSQEAENNDRSIASWRQEDMTIVCREMPRPMRFDSFNVEILLWVQGRVVLLENYNTIRVDSHEYRLTVFPADHDLSASVIDGVPHVCSALHPSDF